MSRGNLAALAGMAVVVALALAASSAARPAVHSATLTLHVGVIQKTDWSTYLQDPPRPCGVISNASGKQTADLHSDFVKVRIVQFGPSPPLLLVGRASTDVPMRFSDLDRKATQSSQPSSSDECSSGTGGPPPPGPDCGTKKISPALSLEFPSRNVIELGGSDSSLFTQDPFKNCPASSDWSNRLMQCTDLQNCDVTNVDQVTVPARAFFNPHCLDISITSGAWTYHHTYQTSSGGSVVGGSETTTMGFVLDFLRGKHPFRRHPKSRNCDFKVGPGFAPGGAPT